MKNFLIGQYQCFDKEKYARDFREGFHGVEACLFAGEEEIERLVEEAQKRPFGIGIHFPLRAGMSELRDPLFLHLDAAERAQVYRLVEDELKYMRKVGPEYVLFHYPKPILLNPEVDWSIWKFGDRREYVYDTEYTYEEFVEHSTYLWQWLEEKSREYDFTPVLEFDAVNRYICESNFIEDLLQRYPRVRLCLDTGRIHLQAAVDRTFAAEEFIRRFAQYTEVVHVSSLRVTDRLEAHHHPALPGLRPEEGWTPVERYLRIIREENPDVKVMFEHRSDWISEGELQMCYKWVEKLLCGSPEV